MIPNLIDFIKPIMSLGFAGMFWLAQTVMPDIPGVPVWVSSLGLPIAMLVAVIYALVATNNSLKESNKGRLEDRDGFIKKLEKDAEVFREDAEKANESRERLIKATEAQMNELRRLGDKIDTHIKS